MLPLCWMDMWFKWCPSYYLIVNQKKTLPDHTCQINVTSVTNLKNKNNSMRAGSTSIKLLCSVQCWVKEQNVYLPSCIRHLLKRLMPLKKVNFISCTDIKILSFYFLNKMVYEWNTWEKILYFTKSSKNIQIFFINKVRSINRLIKSKTKWEVMAHRHRHTPFAGIWEPGRIIGNNQMQRCVLCD